MRAYDDGAFYSVSVSARELQDFAARWPCSGMRDAKRGMVFEFAKSNGDLVDIKLVDIKGEAPGYDEGAVLALSQDAQAYGRYLAVCANCDGPLPIGHGTHSRDGKHRFCDACAGYIDALAIGAGKPVTLYETQPVMAQVVTSWTGEVMGTVTHKLAPQDRRRYLGTRSRPLGGMRGAVRYRVRMLDGSMWHGSGPTENGTYVRLRRMVRQ